MCSSGSSASVVKDQKVIDLKIEGKPIMITNPDSPSAQAFRVSAKNIAAQCSILAAKLQEEMQAEAAASN